MESSQRASTQQDKLRAVADEQAAHLQSLKEKLSQIDLLKSKSSKKAAENFKITLIRRICQ